MSKGDEKMKDKQKTMVTIEWPPVCCMYILYSFHPPHASPNPAKLLILLVILCSTNPAYSTDFCKEIKL